MDREKNLKCSRNGFKRLRSLDALPFVMLCPGKFFSVFRLACRLLMLQFSLASAAAIAGLVTAVKSSWELSRMIKKKYDQRVLKNQANDVIMRLRRALRDGRISHQNYNFWKKKVMIAVWEQDRSALLDIKSYLLWD
ncbi:hypothetical protein B0T21DRAFT_353700 [Apiosordaria backusii]|uniref:Uncharacterized protein n=1 Tax=Apiosordaria backusii TaxID=314023 RepID=A0AA40DHW7_9PEZI|nr:hypothetical protein B0T21DRAFT_353700 [Apiosordaria backusii]